jgi:sugar phosphate isomerase/epimerase
MASESDFRKDQPDTQWFRISLAQWSLHLHLNGRAEPRMDHLDFAATARSYGIDGIEYVNTFFKDKAEDREYLADMKSRADGEGVSSLLIMCDGEGALGDPDQARRIQAVENHYRWIDAAIFLGCHSIRVNAQSRGEADEQMNLAADGLRRLTSYAADRDISVLVENHGGLSSDGSWLAGVMEKVDHPNCGTLPDFGNFNLGDGRQYDRYRGVEELMPHAKAVSAKSYAFDGSGDETTIDYHRMLGIVKDAGYRGWVGIEFEGRALDEYEGIRMTHALLERVRSDLS